MPSLGADMDSGTLVEWLVHEGDTVHRGDPIAVVDTDKSAIEVESFDDGVVESFLVEPGTRVAVGTPLASLTALEGMPAAKPVGAPAAPAAKARIPKPRLPGTVAPPLRHHAAELGVDLAAVKGSGPGGAVTRRDVDLAAEAKTAEAAATAARAAPRPAKAAPRPLPRPERAHVSPYARRLAQELGVALGQDQGTG